LLNLPKTYDTSFEECSVEAFIDFCLNVAAEDDEKRDSTFKIACWLDKRMWAWSTDQDNKETPLVVALVKAAGHVDAFSLQTALDILAFTFPVKQIPERQAYFNAISTSFYSKYPTRAEELLRGLSGI
jgi:hypothetical protein